MTTANTTNTNANTTKQVVEILGFAHALIAGERGAKGGAPSKDSIFGFAKIQGNVVSFGGRRGGVLRYKTYKKTDLALVAAKFESKLSGNPFGNNVEGHYTALVVASDIEALVPNLEDTIKKGFYKAMGTKKLNTRSTKKAA